MASMVLIVDDSAMMRRIVARHLRECGYAGDIIEANDGEEALVAFDSHPVACVLTDWNMPGMNGLSLIRHLRQRDPERHVPIIMITTEATPDRLHTAIQAGADGYLPKPFSSEQFHERLGAIVGALQ
jgi:two-component system chemotaxis response regulator CheY